ncbi:MAG: D-arabinono-1,4-lactone oxidase [Acidimicrobiales bacterium]
MAVRVTDDAVWRNWSGRQATMDATLHHVRSEEDAAALAASAASSGSTVRVAGSGHSHAPLVPTDGVVADLSGLSGVISTDPDAGVAWVWAGTPIHALGRPLHDAGLALANQGDIDRQAIGGAVATGTHGTGVGLGNLSSVVVGARIATASGQLVDCSAGGDGTVPGHPDLRDHDLWEAARLNLGALGVVTRLGLRVRPAYRLAERRTLTTLDGALAEIGTAPASTRHYEFFWYPHRDRAAVKMIDETDEPPVYPIGPEGSRVGWNYEVLPSHRAWIHTEIEYAVDAADGPACMAALRDLVRGRFPDLRWPLEYRFVAADEVWLSPAQGRPTVTISLHQDIGTDDRELFEPAEEILVAHGGRPHWGKVNTMDGRTLAERYPHWADWWRVRDAIDPAGVFLNDYLRGIRPG